MPKRAWSSPACRNPRGRSTRDAKAWYFHRFYDFQPDLNTSNPEVQAEILKIMGFWIQLGVSGFRMDAVPFVISTKGADVRKPLEQYDMLRMFREFLQWRPAIRIILAEANVLPETDMQYFGDDGDRMHMMFNFQVNQNLFYALAAADTRPLVKAMEATKPRPATAQWGLFLRNHDELDLGRLTDEQRADACSRFGPTRGHAALRPRHPAPACADARRRPAADRTRLQPDVHAARHAGAPLRRRARHGRRPLAARAQLRAHADAVVDRAAWRLHQERQAGVPGDQRGPYGFEHVNAAEQRRDPDSMLNWTERIIRMRKEVPEIGWGDFAVLDPATTPCW